VAASREIEIVGICPRSLPVSPLTKLFVVLHVVLSLVLTAGLIVFVNRTEAYNVTNKALAASVASERNRASAAEADAQAATASAAKAVDLANAQVNDMRTQLADARRQIGERDVQLAQGASAQALAAADNSKLAEALKASEDQKSKQSEALAQARTDNDSLIKKNADLNTALTDTINKNEVATSERNNFQEQLTQLQADAENMRKLLADNGIRANQPGGLATGAVPINGVVRSVNPINGIPYATISVGSADNVQKGMQFNVIDRQHGVFLGQLTVDDVQPNEATGRLAGPHINDVKPGVEVRTQL
jgi:hypothetical protein